MRLNQYIALHTGISRRRADQLIEDDKVLFNNGPAKVGQIVGQHDKVVVNGLEIRPKALRITTIILHKPVDYVCSRNGQGSKTIYDLLPTELHHLKPIGRLDKDSSGLLLLTNDGKLANDLTHPSHQKVKVYDVELDKHLSKVDHDRISIASVQLEDGPSKLKLTYLNDEGTKIKVTMHEGRNRQIRRTFASLRYDVIGLHRTKFGKYSLEKLPLGKWKYTV